MPKSTIDIPHNLEVNEAKKKISKLITSLKDEYKDNLSNVKETWSGNNADFSFEIAKISISGALKVLEKNISLTIKYPLLFAAFKGKVESSIKEKAGELLAS